MSQKYAIINIRDNHNKAIIPCEKNSNIQIKVVWSETESMK